MEVFGDLQITAEDISNELLLSRRLEDIIKEFENFENQVQKVRHLLSRNNLYSMSTLAVQLLILLFFIPSIVINMVTAENPNSRGHAHVAIIINLLFVIILCLYIFYINISAERVAIKVQEVSILLKEIYVPNERIVTDLDDKLAPLSFIKTRIVNRLDKFEGFDGQGYFILGNHS